MITLRGTNVYPTAVENILGDIIGVSSNYELHMTQDQGNDEMEIKFEPEQVVPEAKWVELCKQVQQVIKDKLKVRMKVTANHPSSLPRYDLKTKRVFDHRPKEFQRAMDR
tara:strand:- start:148 stop:477 length:330 start_codon:yes stop_codon:yes gene_type:complete